MSFRRFYFYSFLLFLLGCSGPSLPTRHSDLQQTLAALQKPNSQTILVAAHRGAHWDYPENSLAAIEEAIRVGADIVELDVRLTRDGVPVLFHDDKIDRTTNSKGAVRELTYKTLQSLRLKGNDNQFPIPTLHQALTAAKNRIVLDLDLKAVYAKPLVTWLSESETAGQVILFSGNRRMLDSLASLDSTLMLMPRPRKSTDVGELLLRYNPRVLHIDEQMHSDSLVLSIKAYDCLVWINALGVPDIKSLLGGTGFGYAPLVAKGVSIIQTDRPAALLAYLREKGRHF